MHFKVVFFSVERGPEKRLVMLQILLSKYADVILSIKNEVLFLKLPFRAMFLFYMWGLLRKQQLLNM